MFAMLPKILSLHSNKRSVGLLTSCKNTEHVRPCLIALEPSFHRRVRSTPWPAHAPEEAPPSRNHTTDTAH